MVDAVVVREVVLVVPEVVLVEATGVTSAWSRRAWPCARGCAGRRCARSCPSQCVLIVVLEGTADNQSTVTFTPSMFALLEADTTVLVVEDDELDAGDTASNSV